VLAGCATKTVEQPANFKNNPQIVAIYAVDSALGTFAGTADVLIFSSDPSDSTKVSASPPPSYGSYRVEFDQTIDGTTIANDPNRGAAVGGTAAFCTSLGTSPIQLLDVQAANRVVPSSICYDATSALGSHPHVLIIPGDGALTDPAATPLTCNTFAPDSGSGTGGNVFEPKHRYGIQVKSGVAKNAAGKALNAPTGGGWTGDTFLFTTSGLKIMAAGYQDPSTGFFVWLEKPEAGFEKDLAATPSTFQVPTDGSPFIIVLSEPVSDTTGVTLTRGDGSVPEFFARTGGDLLVDPRVIEVNLGCTGVACPPGDDPDALVPAPFEPGQGFRLTVPDIASDVGATDTLGTTKIYAFQTAPGAPANVDIAPGEGAQAQSFTAPPIELTFSVPVTVDATKFKLTDAANKDVPLKPQPDGVVVFANKQLVDLTPATQLTPETTYTISYTGVKVAPGPLPTSLTATPIPDATSHFKTSTFRLLRLQSVPGSAASIDRAVNVNPVTVLKAGTLTVHFNNATAPTGVSNATVLVSEVDTTTLATTKITSNVAPAPGGAPTEFSIALPGYQPKYGKKYEVRVTPGITDPVSSATVKSEGCTGTGSACDDVKSFTTRGVTATIAPDPAPPAAPTGFRVNFSDPIDPASLTPFLTTATKAGEFKLFARNATGAIVLDSAGNPVQVPINCTITNATRVTCTAAASLGNAPQSFLGSAVFLPTATQDPAQGGPSGPAIVAAATSTDASARFSGNASGNIFAACPP